jgi:hypothetical protein
MVFVFMRGAEMPQADMQNATDAAKQAPPTLGDDMLQGIKTIADFLGIQERTAYHLASSGRLPGAFKLGRLWYARRSTLVENIRALEKGEA